MLRALEIQAELRKRWLANTGFYERRKTSFGTYLAGDALDAVAQRSSRLSDMLRGMRGLRVVMDMYGHAHLQSTRGPASLSMSCTPRVYLDGVPVDWVNTSGGDLDSLVFPNKIAAIEAYAGPSEAPLQYAGFAECGVLLLWTKQGD